MADASPRHVGNVKQTVDAAEVDEGAVVGDVLHRAAEHLAFRKRLERRLLLLGVLLFEEDLAGEHDVAALLVDLDHPHPELLPLQCVKVSYGPDVNLRAGQKRAHADIDGEPALDPLDDAADDDLLLGVGLLDLVPDLHLLGLLAREHDVAFAILGALEQHVDHVARLDGYVAMLVEEFADWDEAFGFVADVDYDVGFGDLEDGALDDLAFRHVSKAVVINAEHGRKLLRIHPLVMQRFYSWARSLASPCVLRTGAPGCSPTFSGVINPCSTFAIPRASSLLSDVARAMPVRSPCRLNQPSTSPGHRGLTRIEGLRGPAPRGYNGVGDEHAFRPSSTPRRARGERSGQFEGSRRLMHAPPADKASSEVEGGNRRSPG